MSSDSSIRRRPTQARSRERFDRILAAAATLIGERGVARVTMTDIAEEADMALTAVYRYFPNQQAVLRELALRTFAEDTETLIATGSQIDGTAADLVALGIEEFWRRHEAEPFRLQLRAAIHADAELSALDLAESRRNARAIAELIAQRSAREDLEVLERQALLVVELIDSLMHLVARVEPDEARALVDEFTAMAVRTLTSPPVPDSPAASRPGDPESGPSMPQ